MAGPKGSLGKMLGLGFLFGAKDTGVAKTTDAVQEGFDRVADSVERVGKKSGGLTRFGNVVNVLNSLQLSRITDQLEELGDRAGIGVGGQANQLESFGAEFGQTFRQVTAGMGPFRKEMERLKGQISGTAFSLQIGGEELAKAVAGITKTGSTLDDFGITVRDVGGSIQAQVLDGDQLVQVLTELSRGYNLGDKGAKALLDRQTALGAQFGVGADAVSALPDALKAADPILAKFSNLNVENVTDSLTRLAIAAQKRVGGSFKDAMEDAIAVFNQLGESREQMGKLITGLDSDFPELAKELSIASGDVGQSIENIMADPLTFAKNIQKLMASMDDSDPRFQRLKLSLGEMPAKFQFLVQGGEDAAKALDAASVPIKNTGNAFNKMVRGASGDTRTFADRMELLKDSFTNNLRKMTSSTDAEVVQRQRKAYKRLEKTLDDLRKQGGVKGALTQAFLDIRRHGLIHGLIPSLDKAAKKLGVLDEKANISETTFGRFALLLGDSAEGLRDIAVTAGPMAIVLAQLGVFEHIRDAFDGIGKAGRKFAATVFRPFSRFMGSISKFALSDQLYLIGRAALRVLGPVGLLIGAGILVYKNWDKIGPMVMEIWEAMKLAGDEIVEALIPAFEEIGALATEVWKDIQVGMKILWDDYLKPFGAWLSSKLPGMFSNVTQTVVFGIGMMVEGAKLLGSAFKSSFELAVAGAQMVMAMNPITLLLKSLSALAKLAATTKIGKTLGMDKVASSLGQVSDMLPDMGDSLDDLKKTGAKAWEDLGNAGSDYMKNMTKWIDRAGAAGERVEAGVMLAQSNPRHAATVTPRRRRGLDRVSEILKRTKQAERMEAAAEAAVAPVRYGTVASPDLADFFKKPVQVEFSPRGEEQVVKANVAAKRRGNRPRPSPNDGAGID